jgi:hypothetical protein
MSGLVFGYLPSICFSKHKSDNCEFGWLNSEGLCCCLEHGDEPKNFCPADPKLYTVCPKFNGIVSVQPDNYSCHGKDECNAICVYDATSINSHEIEEFKEIFKGNTSFDEQYNRLISFNKTYYEDINNKMDTCFVNTKHVNVSDVSISESRMEENRIREEACLTSDGNNNLLFCLDESQYIDEVNETQIDINSQASIKAHIQTSPQTSFQPSFEPSIEAHIQTSPQTFFQPSFQSSSQPLFQETEQNNFFDEINLENNNQLLQSSSTQSQNQTQTQTQNNPPLMEIERVPMDEVMDSMSILSTIFVILIIIILVLVLFFFLIVKK